jgi:hypothetical protein
VIPDLHWRQFDAMIGYLEYLPDTQPVLALVLSQIFSDFFSEDEHADLPFGAWPGISASWLCFNNSSQSFF